MLHNMMVNMCNHHLVHWMSIFLFIEWLLLGLEELQALIMAHSVRAFLFWFKKQ